MDDLLLLRGIYLGAAASVLLVFAISSLRTRFLSYGARSDTSPSVNTRQSVNERSENGFVVALLDQLASLRVPHSWFTSFYSVSVACSLYWAIELIFKGPAFTAIAGFRSQQVGSMSIYQVQVVWLMMFVQGSRRLYECSTLLKPSTAKMWVGHWALGIMFYLCANVAIWIEGTPALCNHIFTMQDFTFVAPSFRTFLCVLTFILASGLQYDCHAYLASLKDTKKSDDKATPSTYRLPEHPAWNLSLSPHYFAECLIYLSMTIVAAPAQRILNETLLCALVFVAVNLGVTADGTKKWYAQKFGMENTQGRARMVPFIF